jgi:uncharacterized protein YjdB
MKKLFYLINLILLAILSSCSVKEEIARDVSVSYPVFRGIMEAPGGTSDTRAFADEALHVYWHKYDKASMFYDKTYNREYEYQGRDGTTAGEFKRYGSDPSSFSEVEIESGYNYAIFPYNYDNACDYDGTLTVFFPTTQTFNEGARGNGANIFMVSRSVNGDFMFKHTAGYVGLKLYGEGVTVSRVEFEANNNEPITGYPYVVFNEDDEPFLSFDEYSEAGSKVTLSCDPPVALGATSAEAKTFWFTIPATVLVKGFTVTVTDTNGGTFSKRRSSNYVVERKVFKTMSAFEVVPEGGSDTPTVIPVTGVQIGSSSLALEPGETANLTATVLPSNATDKSVSWSSSNTGVATVDNNGKVTAVAAGSAVITVTTTDGGKTATCTVTVANPAVPVQSVSLNKTELSLNVGESETLMATVLPENADNKAVTWSSGNTAVATVDASGKVTAVAAGSAVITVTTTDGGKTATCTVTVVNPAVPVQSVSLNETELSLNVGESATLTATVLPSNATDKGVSWSSSNTGVATVDNNGKVTAVAAGSSVITVTTTDGGKTATCTVTVIADKDPNHAGDPVEIEEGGDL